MEYKNFTSLPPEEEQSFVVYERTSIESGKKALTLGAICGAVVGVLAIVFYMAFDPPKNAHAVESESELSEDTAPAKAGPAPAPVEEAAAAEGEAPAAEGEAPAAEGEAPAAESEAPAAESEAPAAEG